MARISDPVVSTRRKLAAFFEMCGDTHTIIRKDFEGFGLKNGNTVVRWNGDDHIIVFG